MYIWIADSFFAGEVRVNSKPVLKAAKLFHTASGLLRHCGGLAGVVHDCTSDPGNESRE
jgi:hypothetical protein